jgi:hypothetical protein
MNLIDCKVLAIAAFYRLNKLDKSLDQFTIALGLIGRRPKPAVAIFKPVIFSTCYILSTGHYSLPYRMLDGEHIVNMTASNGKISMVKATSRFSSVSLNYSTDQMVISFFCVFILGCIRFRSHINNC